MKRAFFVIVDSISLAFVVSVIKFIRILPERWGMKICRGVILCLLIGMPRLRGVGLRNLELVFPEKPLKERKRILKESLEVLALNLYNYAMLPHLDKEKAIATVDYEAGKALCEEIYARYPGKGVIIATLHFGSFELLVQLHALIVRPTWILARGFGLPRLDDWWFRQREIYGCRVFRRAGAFPEIIKKLQAGEDVAILYDQNVKVNHATFVDFFGRKAATTKAVGLAAVRTGAPIIFGALHGGGGKPYTLLFEEIPAEVGVDEKTDAAVERITADLNRVAEKFIRQHPESWFWIHRRFKTRPPGEAENIY